MYCHPFGDFLPVCCHPCVDWLSVLFSGEEQGEEGDPGEEGRGQDEKAAHHYGVLGKYRLPPTPAWTCTCIVSYLYISLYLPR